MDPSAESRNPAIDERFILLLKSVLPKIDVTIAPETDDPWLIQWVSERTITESTIGMIESLLRQEQSQMNRSFALTALQSKLDREARYLNQSIVSAGCWRDGNLHLIDIDPTEAVIIFSESSPAPRPPSGLTLDGTA